MKNPCPHFNSCNFLGIYFSHVSGENVLPKAIKAKRALTYKESECGVRMMLGLESERCQNACNVLSFHWMFCPNKEKCFSDM